MSSLLELLQEKLGSEGISQISKQLGSDEKSTQNAVATALPALVGALSRKSTEQAGLGNILGMLDRNGDGNVLDDVTSFLGGGGKRSTSAPGQSGISPEDLLGSLLGGSQSRVETGVQQASGLSSAATSKLLRMLAPMVLGALAKTKQTKGLDQSGLQDFLGNEKASVEKKTGGIIGRLLDQDGDGDFDFTDVAKLAVGKLFGRK